MTETTADQSADPAPDANTSNRDQSKALNRTSWPVKGGTWIGAFRVRDFQVGRLMDPAVLRLREEGNFELSGNFDPSGSAAYAFLATIASTVVAVAMLAAWGAAVAPGWLLWYIIIVVARRRTVSLNLDEARRIYVDRDNRRVAIRTDLESVHRGRWFAFEVQADCEELIPQLHKRYPDRVQRGPIRRPSIVPVVFLVLVIVGVIAYLANYFILQQRSGVAGPPFPWLR